MDSFPIFFGKCVIQKLSIFNCKKFQTLSRLRLQCNSLKTHAHFTDKIAKLISGKYDFINKYDRQYHQFDIYIYVKLLHNYDKSPTVTSCLIWVTVFFLLELSARTLPYEYDSRGQCILCMLENIFANFKIVVWRVLAFSLRILFKFEPPMTAYMFYSAQTLEMLCSLIIESDITKKHQQRTKLSFPEKRVLGWKTYKKLW